MPAPSDQHARIVTAAEAVAARGENPTLTAVRSELGGGSYSTISPVLRAWKAAQARDDEPVREPLPDQIHEAAITGAGEIWRAALELASERLAAERAALNATRVELDEAITEATATADELASQLEQAQSTAQAAAETAAQTEAELREALDTERSQRAEAEQRCAVARALADERQGEIETARTQAQAAAERASAAEALAEARQAEIERGQTLHRELLAHLEPAPDYHPRSAPEKDVISP